MRIRTLLAVAGAAAALAGITAVSAADHAPAPVHVMLVQLPDGSVGQVRYTGDVAPRIVLRPVAAESIFDSAFGPDSPFATMDRIAAEMDAQMAGMMQQAAAMRQTAAPGAPAGATSSFRYVSTSNGGSGCTESVRMVSFGDGKPPQVTRTSSGACGSAARAPQGPAPTAAPVARPAAPPIGRNSI